MKKTITVNLSGQIFTLDDDAYETLQKYLEAIKEYFIKTGEEEVIRDIESSIADKFQAKISPKKQVITKKDVDQLIKVMGTVEDIIEEEPTNGEVNQEKTASKKEQKPYKTGKRLYRNGDDAVIAGVASGLAAFFGIDPVVVRLFFAVSIFFGGAGVILYLILWLVMPLAKTSAEKLEMRGEAVTLETLEEVAKTKSRKLREMDTSSARRLLTAPFRFLAEFFRALGRLTKKCGRGIVAFIGIIIIICIVLTMTAVGFSGAAIAFNFDSPFINSDIPLTDIISPPILFIAIIALVTIILVPLFFLLLLGATMVGRKNSFNIASSSLLIGIWMIAMITAGVIAIDLVPEAKYQVERYANTETITRNYEYNDYDSIRVGTNGQVRVTRGEEFEMKIEGEETVLNKLSFEIEDNELRITQESEREGICIACFKKEVDIEIILPELKSFIAFNKVIAEIKGFYNSDLRINAGEAASVKAYVDGNDIINYIAGTSGRVELIGAPESVNATLEGAGRLVALELDSKEIIINQDVLSRVTLGGRAEKLTAELSGPAKLYAFDLASTETAVKAASHARAEVYPIETLKAIASEHARIYYKGGPDEIIERTTEDGQIIKSEEYELDDLSQEEDWDFYSEDVFRNSEADDTAEAIKNYIFGSHPLFRLKISRI